jgi:ubiquinone/menaquinone biosynthesis C-methylase UbiE
MINEALSIQELYKNRFLQDEKALEKKRNIWKVLCRNFFQKYVSQEDTVLDLAAGYADFINNIRCKKKIAVDLNPELERFADKSVEIKALDSKNLEGIRDSSVSLVFTSNFFEHLPSRQDLFQTLKEIHRVLVPGGKFLILQPNIRFCYDVYWDFIDHQLPLSDRSLCEALELSRFHIEKCIPRFLPFTTKSALPQWPILIKLYLKLPLAWKILGKQAFVVGRKL